LNWRLLAIPVSVVPLLIMVFTTHVSPTDIFAVGVVPFILSTASVIGRIMLQAFRFDYFVRKFIGNNISSTSKIITVRLAGEFVTQTTPSYVGGEIVRIAFLTKNGVLPGKAAWVTTMEIIADVFVGTVLAFIAGGIALFRGNDFIGIAVILVAVPTFVFWLLLLIFSAKRTLRLPSFSTKLLQKFIPPLRAEQLVSSTNNAIFDLCKMSRQNFNSIWAVKIFSMGLAITFIAFLLQGVSFLILANAVGLRLGLFDSLMATSASTALSTLPITVGGSGLAELGIWAYTSHFTGIPSFANIVKDSHLSLIVAWRIASYHVPLIIMWVALMKVTTTKNSFRSLAKKFDSHNRGSTSRTEDGRS
jgi:glycosyltransferase 2 family protein